jgi:hypothetical protein
MDSGFNKYANGSHRDGVSKNSESVGQLILGIAFRNAAFAVAFPTVMKITEALYRGFSSKSAAILKSNGGNSFMNYLYAVLNSIAQNMTLIIVVTVALIVLSMIFEFHVQMTSARSHAPARKVRYNNGLATLEIECSNLQLQEVIRTMKADSQPPSVRRTAQQKASSYEV